MEINGIGSGAGLGRIFPSNGAIGAGVAKGTSPLVESGNFLGELVGKVNDLQTQADSKIRNMMTGESRELHEVMIAVEKAGISFQFLTQVRNKAVESYQEVMRMQV